MFTNVGVPYISLKFFLRHSIYKLFGLWLTRTHTAQYKNVMVSKQRELLQE